jgi:hypothetical protein
LKTGRKTETSGAAPSLSSSSTVFSRYSFIGESSLGEKKY